MRLIDIVDLHTGLTFDVEDHEMIQSVNNGMTPDIKWLNYNNVHIPIVNLRTMEPNRKVLFINNRDTLGSWLAEYASLLSADGLIVPYLSSSELHASHPWISDVELIRYCYPEYNFIIGREHSLVVGRIDGQTNSANCGETNRKMNRETNRETNRKTNRKTHRQTNRSRGSDVSSPLCDSSDNCPACAIDVYPYGREWICNQVRNRVKEMYDEVIMLSEAWELICNVRNFHIAFTPGLNKVTEDDIRFEPIEQLFAQFDENSPTLFLYGWVNMLSIHEDIKTEDKLCTIQENIPLYDALAADSSLCSTIRMMQTLYDQFYNALNELDKGAQGREGDLHNLRDLHDAINDGCDIHPALNRLDHVAAREIRELFDKVCKQFLSLEHNH